MNENEIKEVKEVKEETPEVKADVPVEVPTPAVPTKEVNNKKWKKWVAIGGAVVGAVTGVVAIGVSLVKKSSGDDSVADADFEEVKETE